MKFCKVLLAFSILSLLLISINTQECGNWVLRADMPNGHNGLGCTSIVSDLYYGGTIINLSGQVDVYNFNTDTWLPPGTIPNFSTARNFLTMSSANGKLYAIGGSTRTLVEEFDFITPSWVTKAPIPDGGRFSHAAVVIGDKIYIVGGNNNMNQEEDSILVYDATNNVWDISLTGMPTVRSELAASVLGDELIFALGGYDFPTLLDTNEAYNVTSDSWIQSPQISNLPQATRLFSATTLHNRVFILGGIIPGNTFTDEVFAYDMNANVWNSVASLIGPDYGLCALAIPNNDTIYGLGGVLNSRRTQQLTCSPPSPSPTPTPTASPSPTSSPTATPTTAPTSSPTATPTTAPTSSPTATPTPAPTPAPTPEPNSSTVKSKSSSDSHSTSISDSLPHFPSHFPSSFTNSSPDSSKKSKKNKNKKNKNKNKKIKNKNKKH